MRWERDSKLHRFNKLEKSSSRLRFVKPLGAWTVNLGEIPISELEANQDWEIYVTAGGVSYSMTVKDALTKGFRKILGGEDKFVLPIDKMKEGYI